MDRRDQKNKMGSDASSSAAASPSGKRSRDPEDEVYVDNLHSHKRYLSEIMASSLNGLTVGDQPLPDTLMDSPARSDSVFYLRDEMSLQYSPMSEDSADCLYYESSSYACSPQSESRPTSPVSPYKNQRSLSGVSSNLPTAYTAYGCALQARQRSSESEGRFPSSPSDICHSADLRRAALLRSVQMRSQPVGSIPCESASSSGQEPCSCMISLVDERVYDLEDCSVLDPPVIQEKSCGTCSTNLKSDNAEP